MQAVRAFLIASAPVIIVLIVGVIAFQVVASELRTVPGPGGESMERQGRDRLAYTLIARLAFYALYASAVLWTMAWGYSTGHRLAGKGTLVSAASTIALAGLMALTLPLVDFFNACLVGTPFVLADTTC